MSVFFSYPPYSLCEAQHNEAQPPPGADHRQQGNLCFVGFRPPPSAVGISSSEPRSVGTQQSNHDTPVRPHTATKLDCVVRLVTLTPRKRGAGTAKLRSVYTVHAHH